MSMNRYTHWLGMDKSGCHKACAVAQFGAKHCFGFSAATASSTKSCYLHMKDFSYAVTAEPNMVDIYSDANGSSIVWSCYKLHNQVQSSTSESTPGNPLNGLTSLVSADEREALVEPEYLFPCVDGHFLGPHEYVEVARVGDSNASMDWLTLLDAAGDPVALPVAMRDWGHLSMDECPLPREPVKQLCGIMSWTHRPLPPSSTSPSWGTLGLAAANVIQFCIICAMLVCYLRKNQSAENYHCWALRFPMNREGNARYMYERVDTETNSRHTIGQMNTKIDGMGEE